MFEKSDNPDWLKDFAVTVVFLVFVDGWCDAICNAMQWRQLHRTQKGKQSFEILLKIVMDI